MKQMEECLRQAAEGKHPLPKKWKAVIQDEILYLIHYHHPVLVYDLDKDLIMHSWWEKPADKRGLDSALHLIRSGFLKKEVPT